MTASPIVQVNAQIAIPRREIQFSFVRSSGPGGQNVNKVASKAVLRWQVATSPSIPDHLRARLIGHLGRRMNDRGELVLASQRYRDQSKNIDDCLEKLCDLVAAAVKVRKRRKKTALPQVLPRGPAQAKAEHRREEQARRRPGNLTTESRSLLTNHAAIDRASLARQLLASYRCREFGWRVYTGGISSSTRYIDDAFSIGISHHRCFSSSFRDIPQAVLIDS